MGEQDTYLQWPALDDRVNCWPGLLCLPTFLGQHPGRVNSCE